MALYQPTNIIPSHYTKGVVDVNDLMEISWQVNGNSALSAFQIDFYLNNFQSTLIKSTRKLTENIPAEGFYGIDRFGRPKFFTWNSNLSWKRFSNDFTNGREYKYKITQWYKGNNEVVSIDTHTQFAQNAQYYFIVPLGVSDAGAVISFYALHPNEMFNAQFNYSLTNKNGFYEKDGQYYFIDFIINVGGKIPNGAIQLTEQPVVVYKDEFLLFQTVSNIIVTVEKPKFTIYRINEQNKDLIEFTNYCTIATSIGFFSADYKQKQTDPIRWIRWQVASVDNGNVGAILEDTGNIYTPTPYYEYSGFFNERQYAIRCFGESENGHEIYLDNSVNGWIIFNVHFENQETYIGQFNVQAVPKENVTLLEWEGVEVIPYIVNPQDYKPNISNGSVTLNGKNGDIEHSISWNKQIVYNKSIRENEIIPIKFDMPWTAVWSGKLNTEVIKTLEGYRLNKNLYNVGVKIEINPSGTLMVIGGQGTYRITESKELVLISKNNPKTETDSLLEFSPTGEIFVVADVMCGFYRVDGENFIEIDIDASNKICKILGVTYLKFNNNGDMLLICTKNEAHIITIKSGKIEYCCKILRNGEDLDGSVKSAVFIPNTDLLVLGGEFSGRLCVFSIRDDAALYLYDIKKNKHEISGEVSALDYYNNNLLVGGNGCDNYLFTDNDFIYNSTFVEADNLITNLVVSGSGIIVASYGKILNSFIIESGQLIRPLNVVNIVGAQTYNLAFDSADNLYAATSPKVVYPIVVGGLEIYEKYFSITKKYFPQGKLMEITGNNILLANNDNNISLKIDTSELINFDYPDEANKVVFIISPLLTSAYFYNDNILLNKKVEAQSLNDWQQPITSISIYGGNNGSIVDSVSVFQGNGNDILSLYDNPEFEPVWNDPNYDLYMTANFNGNLEGGTGTATGSGFRIYRQEIGKNFLIPIATVPSTITSIKDFGIASRKVYKYSLYAYDNNGAFMSVVDNEKIVSTCFKNYSLLVCDYDENNDEYHVRKQYLFALNLSTGSVSNNNSPTLNANFTRYPTRMPSSQNYATGTLQGLIGAIYNVPALVENIGNNKYTTKPSTLDYFDNVDLEKELSDLSIAPYQLFLRDMKGRIRMVHTNSPITMTTNILQRQESISISLPWVEIGDASDVKIVQTSNDYGWNNDNQVLTVSLDVNVKTGELTATYPFPYNGTKFFLSGENEENLTTKVPIGVTPAQFEFSRTAMISDDGKLKTTVKTNELDK